MSKEPYLVTRYEPLQVMPCVGSGLLANFEEPEKPAPVVAMAVCRVRCDWYEEGRFVGRESVTREVCGVITFTNEGFGICESFGNFRGYTQPNESAE